MEMMKKLIVKVLEILTGAEALVLMLSMCAMDSPDIRIPLILMGQALAWIYVAGHFLGLFEYDEDYDFDDVYYFDDEEDDDL